MARMAGAFQGRTVVARETDGARLSEDVYAAGSRLGRHVHALPFFSLTLAGGYVERHGTRGVEYAPDSVAFHPAGEEHEVAVGTAELRCLNVEVRSGWLDGVAAPPRFVRAVGGPLAWLAHQLHAEARDSGASLAVEGLVVEMLGLAARPAAPMCDRLPPRWLREVDDVLQAEYTSPPTLGVLAQRLGVHPVHLSRTWRRFRQCSLGDAQRRLRIDEARRRLAGGGEPILEVALDLGFADQAHFTRTFRRVTGTTPRAWRRAHRGRG
jgi:AraC family transcriptional regulator